jgi:hypothetical protein
MPAAAMAQPAQRLATKNAFKNQRLQLQFLSSWWWTVCLPKHVEQLRNIVIINPTTRSNLVGSFYVFYITMHGSMNIKFCSSSNEIDSPVRGQTVYTRRWPAVRGHVHGNSPLVLFPHVSSKSRDVNIIKPSVSKGRWSHQNVFRARPATAVSCWHPTVLVASQQASFH